MCLEDALRRRLGARYDAIEHENARHRDRVVEALLHGVPFHPDGFGSAEWAAEHSWREENSAPTETPAQPAQRAASLDTRGITRQPSETPKESLPETVPEREPLPPERLEWLGRVGGYTWTYREARALELDRKAKVARAKARAAGAVDDVATKAGKWFADRAKGQRSRVGNVRSCQRSSHVLRVRCQACSSSKDHPIRCGVGLLCVSCRGKIAEGRRARIGRARDVVLARAKRVGLTKVKRRGGRWDERFVTLTIPHFEDLGVRERIDLVSQMWPHFNRAMRTWMRENHRQNMHFSAWYRGQEWTRGSDSGGHPHIHFWMFGPFLPRDLVQDWWNAALERCGRSSETPIIVDVRAADAETICELVKYIVKDLDDGGDFLEPELYAEVYEAIDGRRMSQGSKGFLKLGDRAARCACGAEGCFLSQLVPAPHSLERTKPELASRAPP